MNPLQSQIEVKMAGACMHFCSHHGTKEPGTSQLRSATIPCATRIEPLVPGRRRSWSRAQSFTSPCPHVSRLGLP